MHDIEGNELKEGDTVGVLLKVKQLFRSVNGAHYARLRVIDPTDRNRIFDLDVHADLVERVPEHVATRPRRSEPE